MHHSLDKFLFTSESVASGHPDKICDQISDSILDHYLALDPNSRVAVESMVTPENVIIAGEVSGPEVSKEKIEEIARNCIKEIGYEQEKFHYNKVKINNFLIKQSADIALGVDETQEKEEGAGDQGIMFGYACNETPSLMPAPIYYAHKILENIEKATKNGELSGIGPDGKSQVTLQYVNNIPVKATKLLVSVQHHSDLNQKDVRELIRPYVENSIPQGWMCEEIDFLVNPTGRFVIGGPESDSGLTGRKIIVDTYGGAAPHGGGAFSGKDPSKVDRSGAYMARFIAKNVVAAGLAERCTIQISYAIGVAEPLSFYINTHNSSDYSEADLAKAIRENLDLRPKSIKTLLDLKRPIYKPSATFGHFGRQPSKEGHFSWEKTEFAEILRNYFKHDKKIKEVV